MRKDLIEIVCCPDDKAKLALDVKKADEHGDVEEGTLTCTECGFVYPIEQGIPNLLPPAYHRGKATKGGAKAGGKGSGAKPAGKPMDSAAGAEPAAEKPADPEQADAEAALPEGDEAAARPEATAADE